MAVHVPNHLEAKRIAAEASCPVCSADLQVNPSGAYIDCVSDTCGWLGWSYEYLGATTPR